MYASDDRTDVRTAAFKEACQRRSEEEKQELKSTAGAREMFSQLSKTDVAHQNISVFRKGIRALSPVVSGLNRLVDIANPITKFVPTAASGLAIIKSVVTVRIIGSFSQDPVLNTRR